MKLNPITALLEPIEKLITEHGSAVIQEKHIALLREQLLTLKEKLLILATDKDKTDRENEQLKSENQTLNIEIKKLREKIQKYEQPHIDLLDQIQEQILLFLHSRKKATIEQVAQNQKLSLHVAKMHLKKLFDRGMVITYPDRDRLTYWQLKEPGTEYLIKHKLISQQGVSVDG